MLHVTEGRILELHSPDGVHECWLRASDNAEASVWFNALHSALAALTLKALRLASALPDPPQLQHIGWLARRHCLQVRFPIIYCKLPKRLGEIIFQPLTCLLRTFCTLMG